MYAAAYPAASSMRAQHPACPRIQTNVARPCSADVPRAVATLLATTKELQNVLQLWSVLQVSEQAVSDVYVRLGDQFNATVSAFQCYNIHLRELHAIPAQLRTVLEDCLSDNASSEVLAAYMPRVRQIIKELLQGLRSKQPAYWHAVGHSPPVSSPFSPYSS